ncbi:MAG: hypothetical protein ACRDWW_07630 [Acidimicrobiales bacterium]
MAGLLGEASDLDGGCHLCLRQMVREIEDIHVLGQLSVGKLARYPRVGRHPGLVQQPSEEVIAGLGWSTQMEVSTRVTPVRSVGGERLSGRGRCRRGAPGAGRSPARSGPSPRPGPLIPSAR